VISTALNSRAERGANQKRIVISVNIRDANKKRKTERALIDSGAEENCIWQSLVVEYS
jgi:hypothetical protein